MFFCEGCRVENSWPCSISQSEGNCECCGKPAVCYDVPSRDLPNPAGTSTRRKPKRKKRARRRS